MGDGGGAGDDDRGLSCLLLYCSIEQFWRVGIEASRIVVELLLYGVLLYAHHVWRHRVADRLAAI